MILFQVCQIYTVKSLLNVGLLGELEKPESASQDKQTASSLKHLSLQFDWLINHVFLEWLLISFIPKLDWLIDYRLLLEWLLTYIYLYL